MSYIKPERLNWKFVRDKAEEFRKKFIQPPDKVPVPIDKIVEIDLKIEPRPIPDLKRKIDIDGFLSNNLKCIFIDSGVYFDPRFENRLRFTLAHEIGHLVLHREQINKCQFRTEEDWIHFREDMTEYDLNWFEQQANEFGGRLLVPKKRLVEELEKKRSRIERVKSIAPDITDDSLIQAVSNIICSTFGVSDSVIFRRIQSEKIWKELFNNNGGN